jgi:hypothetical protein
MDVGAAELDEDVRLSRVEAVEQAEWEDVGIDHARLDALAEGRQERGEVRKARLPERLEEHEALFDGCRLLSSPASLSPALLCFAVQIGIVGQDRIVVAVAAGIGR